MDEDISTPPPIPEPALKKKKLNTVHSALQWMLYFLLVWQSITHISDNGLTWLLQSIFHFLHALNIHVPSDILVDIYDGKLWNDFQTVKGKDFLNSPKKLWPDAEFRLFPTNET